MNENINLCEILKGHEGETFYSPLIGNITLNKIREEYAYSLMFISRGLPYHFTSDGKYNIDNVECLLFPSKEQRDWNKWLEEQKPKVPKTYNELVDFMTNTNIVLGDFAMVAPIDINVKIINSASAFLKIYELIKVGYGGNITNEEWKRYTRPKYFIEYNNESRMFKVMEFSYIRSNIAFHTKEQAEEFLKYEENIQLLKDYFMIND